MKGIQVLRSTNLWLDRCKWVQLGCWQYFCRSVWHDAALHAVMWQNTNVS